MANLFDELGIGADAPLERVEPPLEAGGRLPGPAAATHSGLPGSDRATRRDLFEELGIRQAARDLSVQQQITESARRGVTHGGPGGPVPAPGGDLTQFSPSEAPTTVADRATRLDLADRLQTVGRAGLELAGGIKGAQVGARLADDFVFKGAGKRAIEAVGAGIGEGLGALAAQPIDPVQDPVKNAAQLALFGAFADGLVSTVYGAANRVLRGSTGEKLVADARQTTRLLGPGNSPTAGRLSTSQAVDVMENVVENSLTSGGKITKKNEAAAQRATALIRQYVSRFAQGATREQVDTLVSQVVKERTDAFKVAAKKFYDQIDTLAPVGVDTAGLIQYRNKLVAENQEGAYSETVNKIVTAIDRTLGVPNHAQGIKANVPISSEVRYRRVRKGDPRWNPMFPTQEYPEVLAKSNVSFRSAQQLRSDLLTMGRDEADVFASKAAGIAESVAGRTDAAMEAAALATGNQEVFQLWRTANAFWKDGAETFAENVMVQLANARPDDVRRIIMAADSPQQIARFRRLVLGGAGGEETTAVKIREKAKKTIADPGASKAEKFAAQQRLDTLNQGVEAWDKFVGGTLLDVLNGADPGSALTEAGKGTRTLIGSTALDRLNALGDETLRELFANRPLRRKQAERLLRALETAQADTGLSTGRLVTQFAQGSAVIRLFSDPLSTITVLVSPAAMGRLATNEDFIRWATVGSSRRLKGREYVRMAARVATIAAQEGAEVYGSDGTRIDPNQLTSQGQGLLDTQSAVETRR